MTERGDYSEAEAERVLNEGIRQDNEKKRQSAEKLRQEAEKKERKNNISSKSQGC